jgi:hypothetical protein
MKTIILLPAVLLATLSAFGSDFYVATTGNDSNPGSQAQPWLTINHATTVAGPGDTVHVLPGTYNTSGITNSISGSSGSPITFVSDTKWGAHVVVTGNPDSCWGVAASWIVINGFDVTEGSSGSCRGGLINTSGSNVTFTNNRVHDLQHSSVISGCTTEGGEGIGSFPGTSNLNIIANEIFNIGFLSPSCTYIHGIYDNSSGQIINNLIFHNAGFGANVTQGNVDVINNTIFNQNAGGLFLGQNHCGHHVNNNLIYSVGIGNSGNQAGISYEYSCDSAADSSYIDNLIFQPSGSQSNNWLTNGSGAIYTGYINADPQFVNYTGDSTGNYDITSSSPAKDAGVANLSPTVDFNGGQRPFNVIWDIGAYEYGASTATASQSTTPNPPTGLQAVVQ